MQGQGWHLLSLAMKSAFLDKSNSLTATCPSRAAQWRGVSPLIEKQIRSTFQKRMQGQGWHLLSLAMTSAFLDKSTSLTATCPSRAARWRGVSPLIEKQIRSTFQKRMQGQGFTCSLSPWNQLSWIKAARSPQRVLWGRLGEGGSFS